MLLYFPSLSLSSNIKSYSNVHKSQSQRKRIPSLAKLQTSSGTPFESSFTNISSITRDFNRPSTGQANAIGIIGGEFAESTIQFAQKVMNLNLENGEDCIPLVTCSDQTLKNEFLSLGGSYFSVFSDKNRSDHTDPSSLVENLRLQRRFIEKSGKVSCIVMPCNLSHTWHDEIKEGCSLPFLHMGECVAKELREAKLRPLEAGSLPRIGILAIDNESSVATFYRDKLENEGFSVIVPDKGTMEHILIPAVEALSKKDIEGSRNLLRISVRVLLVRAANRVILASDELCRVLPPGDPLWSKCIDPMDSLARSAAKYVQYVGRSR